jgi:hypothetical protein
MRTQLQSAAADLLQGAGLRPLNASGLRTIITLALAVLPPFVCAAMAETSANWDLFERSGSITAAVGLVVASRRYIHYGAIELLRTRDELKSDVAEMLEDIFTQKLGFALSAFGMMISGWGKYLGWWSFSYIAVWVLLAIHDVHRDAMHLQKERRGTKILKRQ